MKPLNLVWIGGGDRAKAVIYPAFDDLRRQGKAAVLGICHTNAARREEFAARYGLEKQYGAGGMYDYQKMIRELKPDAAVVIGQPNIMYDCWVWCLEQGLHLFIEKPMGLSLHQARALAALAERHKRITQVAFQRRYSPMVTKLRDQCLARGPLTQALCKFYKYEPADNFRARDHLMDDTIHAIDTLRWMAGSEVLSVESRTARNGVRDINFIAAQLGFAGGCTGHLLNNWSSGKRIFAVEMHAPGIFVEAEHEGKGYVYTDGNLTPQMFDAAESAGSSEFYVYTGVLALAEDFVKCCREGGEPGASFARSLDTMKIAELILAQSLQREGLT
jgi:predicted dehydrogenase